MGNLDLDKRYTWEPADLEVSKTMQAYFVNFIKTNGASAISAMSTTITLRARMTLTP